MKNEVWDNIDKFIFGGNAEFTVLQEDPNSGKPTYAKYRVSQCKNSPNLYFVHTERLGNKELEFHGTLRFDKFGKCSYYKGKRVNDLYYNEKAVKALIWILANCIKGLLPYVHVLHHGKCSRCGRKLIDAVSLMWVWDRSVGGNRVYNIGEL